MQVLEQLANLDMHITYSQARSAAVEELQYRHRTDHIDLNAWQRDLEQAAQVQASPRQSFQHNSSSFAGSRRPQEAQCFGPACRTSIGVTAEQQQLPAQGQLEAATADQEQLSASAQSTAGAADQQQFLLRGATAGAADASLERQQSSASGRSVAGAAEQQQSPARGSTVGAGDMSIDRQHSSVSGQSKAGAAEQQQSPARGCVAGAGGMAIGSQRFSVCGQSMAGGAEQQQLPARGSMSGAAVGKRNPAATAAAAVGTITEMKQWAIEQELSMMGVSTPLRLTECQASISRPWAHLVHLCLAHAYAILAAQARMRQAVAES